MALVNKMEINTKKIMVLVNKLEINNKLVMVMDHKQETLMFRAVLN